MSDLKLTPSLLSMLERIERHSGTLLMLAPCSAAAAMSIEAFPGPRRGDQLEPREAFDDVAW